MLDPGDRQILRDFNQWLRDLRTHFYDFTEGWVGPEGDPLWAKAKMERFDANSAPVAVSRTTTDLELGYDGFREAGPAVKASGLPVQLPLL